MKEGVPVKKASVEKAKKTVDQQEIKFPEQCDEVKRIAGIMQHLDKLIAFVDKEVKDIEADEIVAALVLKARHYGYVNCQDSNPHEVIVWLISLVMSNAQQVWELVKDQKEKDKSASERKDKLDQAMS